jgi:hypothetical protein
MNKKQSYHLLGDADETLPIKYTSKNGDYFIFFSINYAGKWRLQLLIIQPTKQLLNNTEMVIPCKTVQATHKSITLKADFLREDELM